MLKTVLLSTITTMVIFSTTTTLALTQAMQCPSKQITWDKLDAMLNIKHSADEPMLYFIQNNSTRNIILNHLDEDDAGSAKAGWASTLSPKHWSALWLTSSDFALNCAELTNAESHPVNCRAVLKICEAIVVPASKMSGDYWYVENKNWDAFLPAVNARMHAP